MKHLDAWKMPLSGTSLIEASAGTGKTYTLTTLYLRLLVDAGLSPSEILVVTYTDAATAELRERVRERIQAAIDAVESVPDNEEEQALRDLALRAKEQGRSSGRPDALRRALQEFDEAAIFTIHGFCQRTLQENAFESGMAFDAELVEKPDLIERTLAHDLWAQILEGEDPDFVEWLITGAGKRWQFDPDALRAKVLKQIGADEEMPLLPAKDPLISAPDPEALRARVVVALRAWARSWNDRREVVAGLLLGENGQSKNIYNKKAIEKNWLPAFDVFAARIDGCEVDSALALLALPGKFGNLTNSVLAERTNSGKETLQDPCFAFFDEASLAFEALKAALEHRALGLRWWFVAAAREAARIRREQRHLLFFDDLLSELRRALRGPRGERLRNLLRERYRFALIDEFQDTDPVQYDTFRMVWHEGFEGSTGRGLVLIGDPKQAIYSFRGADVFTYLAARADAREGLYSLPINWRSDPGLIEAINSLFRLRSRAFQIDAIEFDPVEPRKEFKAAFEIPGRSPAGLRVLFANRTDADESSDEEIDVAKTLPARFGRTVLMASVARDIADLLDARGRVGDREIVPSDIAILCRKKSELRAMRRALEALGVPCVDRGDADVFDSPEAWEFVCVLRALMRSADPATLRAALSTGAHGWDAGRLAALDDEAPELAEISQRFSEYGRIWSQSGFGRAFETWRRDEGVTERLLANEDGERRLTNWLHLAELLQRVASQRAPSRASLVVWLERSIVSEDARALTGSEASLLRLERDDDAISLVTLHRSKGLEYPIVYLPSLWEEAAGRGPSVESAEKGDKRNPPVRFHDAETGRRTLDLGDPENYSSNIEQGKNEEFSEQLRLLYVGLTRAKHQCVVAWGAIGPSHTRTPLAWLLQGPLVEGEGLAQDAAVKKMKSWSDEDWVAAWERLGEGAGPCVITVENANFNPRDRWQAPAAERPPLAYSAPERVLGRGVRTTSFSALVREGHRASAPANGPEITGRDLDANIDGPRRSESNQVDLAEPDPDLAANMHEFPRGADAGTLLHEVLERVDFANYHEAEVRRLGSELLERNGLDAGHVDQVVHVVDSVARTPLRRKPNRFSLSDVAAGQLRPEIEFTLATPGDSAAPSFAPKDLAALLAQSPEGSPLARYSDRVGRMQFRELNGYLRGFIDATFFDGERYFLVDYKSNHLGDRQVDYRPEALIESMIDHDYVLQYLVYSVALDRHLSRRLAGYDYERHFGGAYYLFLRGFAEEHEASCGVFFDRPDPEILRGVSELMGHGSEGAP